MSDTLERIKKLYDFGLTYQQYIDTAELNVRDKHLQYLQAMKLRKREVKRTLEINRAVKLLVFCSSYCKDCRIVISVLENMHEVNPLLQFRIADREGNRDIMMDIDMNCRIPLIIAFTPSNFKVVYNEFPKSLYKKIMGELDDNKKETIRQNYRMGLFKAEILTELINELS
jgi:hypothetical protein